MNKCITNEQAQDVFIKICQENEFQIYKYESFSINAPYVEYKIEHIPKHIPLQEEKLKKLQALKYVPVEDFVKTIDFFNFKDNPHISVSNETSFSIVAQFLKKTNLSTVKNLNWPHWATYKNWKSILEPLAYMASSQDAQYLINQQGNLSCVMSKYISTFNNRELTTTFDILKKVEIPPEMLHKSLTLFCSNHLDKILNNINYKNFIYSKIKDLLPQQNNFYKEFLQVETSFKSFFSEEQSQYKSFHLNKELLIKTYPLVLEEPAQMDDYYNLLNNAVSFLNKKESLKKINCHVLDLNKKQSRYENLVLSVETKENFNPVIIETFLQKVLEKYVEITELHKNEKINIYKLKDEAKNSYSKILDFSLLSNKLEPKTENKKIKNKI